MNAGKKVSIVIPTYNESDAITNTINSYLNLQLPYPLEIIVVDDNSPDGTSGIVSGLSSVDDRIKLLLRKNASGFGSALIDGTKAASGDYVVWTMADGCDDTNAVPHMIEKLDNGFDLVIASRNADGGSRGDQSLLKSLCSKSFSNVSRLIFGLAISDCTNAFRAFKKEIITSVNIKANDFSVSPELSIKASKAGFKLAEVPVSYKERSGGQTKFKIRKMGKVYSRLFIDCALHK